MTDLKFIVSEVNKLINTDYNMISFDALPIANLVQILVDVLHDFGALSKFDVKESDPDFTKTRILEALNRIQYHRVEQNYAALSRKLLIGDKNEIYNIFQYIFKDSEKNRNAVYLSKYLIPIALPPEALANPDIGMLQDEYNILMSEFKEAHKQYQKSMKENSQVRELRSDIDIIEMEKENVKKRIDRTQSRLDKLSNQELVLESAHALRIERERQKELKTQLEHQTQDIQRASTIHMRLQNEMKIARTNSMELSPQQIMNSLEEKTQVLQFMVEEKLPKEITAKKLELQAYEDVINERNINNQYLNNLQNQIDKLSRETKAISESRLVERESDNLLPFRQQAATVIRIKETSAEQLDDLTKSIREIDATIARKQAELKERVGETYLRGDDLKQYVNMLKAKSSVYKKQRAELSALEIEYKDLERTLEKLKDQHPSLYIPTTNQTNGSDDADNSGLPDDIKPLSDIANATPMDISRLVTHLSKVVSSTRDEVSTLLHELQPLKERIMLLKDDCDEKKKTYNALQTQLNTEYALIQSEITETENSIKDLERTWKHLQEIQRLKNDKNNIGIQRSMWLDLNRLLSVKIECHRDAAEAGAGGILSVNKGAETFTLS
ncbi:intraflagellar transport protein 81 homolog isoform X2 [Contarinia nasturtii]|uniref:intraflagellar transport protein 81 homolog isoform X2 n=1 Tax=Contarinia nasturtii TaxID=265458 RepID=UPI0012D4387D|nr:intraflagellar transport protein 81 homolog isoform X2 [Contarinia nasturtii]